MHRRLLARAGIVFTLALASPPVWALNPERSVAQYAHESWGAKDGLPEGPVFAIHQTKDGFLWLGTMPAIVRFDGKRFLAFEEGQRGLGQYSHARDLLEVADGSLYVALAGGVARVDRGHFDFFDERAGLAHPFVYALAPGPRGSVWVGTGGAGIWQLRDGTLTRHAAYAGDATLPPQINDLQTGPDGTLWAATDHGVLSLGARSRLYSLGEGLPSEKAGVLTFDRNGGLWVGTRGGLARLEDGDRFVVHAIQEGAPPADVSALFSDRDGTLWVGTYDGRLARIVGGRAEPARATDVVADGGVLALAEDREGSLWVGTGNGLERYQDGAFATVGAEAGFGSAQILSVAARKDGGLWVLDATGAVFAYDNGRAHQVARPGTIAGEGMLGMFESEDGSLWIGGQKLRRFHDGKWEAYQHPGGEFAVIVGDGPGLLLAQTAGDGTSTLSRFRDGRFEPVPTPERLRHVQRITRDRAQRLWISTGGGGLLRLDSQGSHTFRTSDGLPHDTVYSLAEDDTGDVWVATRAGLARIRGDSVTNLARIEGTPDRAPVQLQLDRLGSLWVAADDGIFRISLAELRAAADGRARSVGSRRFTVADGLKSIEVSWRCSAQAHTADGLWYATTRGLSVIDPRQLERPTEAPAVEIEDLIAGGRALLLAPAVTIGTGRERIEIRYTAPSLTRADELQFRYQLSGYDADWVDARSRRAAYYTGIPAGDYRFRVAVRRENGDWSEAGAVLALHIEPRWNETALARALYTIAAALVLLGLYRFRVRRMRVQKQALVKQVTERTAELRAEVAERRNAEEQVRRLNAGLEARVRDRTAELETANLALAADVAARQRTEAALADEKEKLAVTLRSIAEGVVTVDLEGRVLTMNPVAERLCGWQSAEATRRPLSEVMPIGERFHRGPLRSDPVGLVLVGRESGSSQITQAVLSSRTGREILIDASAAPIHDGRGRVVGAVLVVRDVTEKTHADEQIQKTQKLEAVGILAGGIAHDFNNLLTGIFGLVDLTRRKLPSGEPRLLLDEVFAELENARGLAGQLLTFASGGTPATAAHSLRELLDRSARFVLSGSGVSVDLDAPSDLDSCDVDPLQIRQVVDNLVLNARQVLPRGGHVKIAARNVALSGHEPARLPPGRYVEVAISDDGPGISETIRERIFDPFFTTKSTGTGLGLATVRSIVSQHGGFIDFDCPSGGGTTFRFLLRSTGPAAPGPANGDGKGAGSSPRGCARILAMDDEPQIRNLIKMGLEPEGYEIVVSGDGNEAIALHGRAAAEGRPFDLVILDLTVAGGMGGVDTLARLRGVDPGLRAIASSGYSRHDTDAELRRSGFDGILPKPYKLDSLAALVAEVLALHTARRPEPARAKAGP